MKVLKMTSVQFLDNPYHYKKAATMDDDYWCKKVSKAPDNPQGCYSATVDKYYGVDFDFKNIMYRDYYWDCKADKDKILSVINDYVERSLVAIGAHTAEKIRLAENHILQLQEEIKDLKANGAKTCSKQYYRREFLLNNRDILIESLETTPPEQKD